MAKNERLATAPQEQRTENCFHSECILREVTKRKHREKSNCRNRGRQTLVVVRFIQSLVTSATPFVTLIVDQTALQCHISGMVAGTNKRAAGNFLEAHLLGDLTQFFKLLRRHVTLDWQVALARL